MLFSLLVYKYFAFALNFHSSHLPSLYGNSTIAKGVMRWLGNLEVREVIVQKRSRCNLLCLLVSEVAALFLNTNYVREWNSSRSENATEYSRTFWYWWIRLTLLSEEERSVAVSCIVRLDVLRRVSGEISGRHRCWWYESAPFGIWCIIDVFVVNSWNLKWIVIKIRKKEKKWDN